MSSGFGGCSFFACSRLTWCDRDCTAASAAPSADSTSPTAAPLASAARRPALTSAAPRPFAEEPSMSLQPMAMPRAEIIIACEQAENYLTRMDYATAPAEVWHFFAV